MAVLTRMKTKTNLAKARESARATPASTPAAAASAPLTTPAIGDVTPTKASVCDIVVIDSPFKTASVDEASNKDEKQKWWQCGVTTFGPKRLLSCQIMPIMHKELLDTVPAFWLRRTTRRKVLRQLAEDAARVWQHVRRKSAELRAAAAEQRLKALRDGDYEGYASLVSDTKEKRLKEILEETDRILGDLKAPTAADAADVEPPAMIRGEADCPRQLMPHQVHGFRWLVSMIQSDMSGILADDMGLGKTIQTVSLLAHLMEKRGEGGPHLILAPLSTLPHWVETIATWLPTFNRMCFRGHRKQVEVLKSMMSRDVNPLNVVVTNYESAVSHAGLFGHYPWHMVVVDEGQRIKNCKTRLSQIVRTFPCRHRLLLTGTPIQNSLRELWSLLAFVAPNSFGSLDDFEQWFALPTPASMRLNRDTEKAAEDDIGAAAESEASKLLSEEEEMLIIQRLHRVLRPFLLRRTKDMVLKDLPERREVVIWTPLSAWQAQLYNEGLSARHAKGGAGIFDLARLRQSLNHPYHFLEGEVPAAGSSDDRLVSASGKFEFLDRVLPRLISFGHKTLIFAQMTGLLDLLQLLLARLGIRYSRIDGGMSLRQRMTSAAVFQKDPMVGVLLLTTRAGGLGLNLQVADTVVLFDSDWNPQVDFQAMDRAHRIGQQKPVLVVRLATPTHLDRGLLERAGQKIDMEQKVISAGRFFGDCQKTAARGEDGSKEEQGFLRRLIADARRRPSASVAARGAGATPIEEASRLLARSPEERAAFEAADLEMLGPAGTGDGGSAEGAAQRLERCGRLMATSDLRSLKRAATTTASSRRALKRRRSD